MTYGTIKTLLAYKYGESSAPSTGVENRNAFINLAMQDIASRHTFSWRLKNYSAVANGTTSETLPTDFSVDGFKQGTLKVGGIEYLVIKEGQEQFYSHTESDGTVDYQDGLAIIKGNKSTGFTLYFPSAPTAGSAITGRYFSDPADLSADADVCIVPDGDAVASLAYAQLLESEGEVSEAQVYREQAENKIGQMIEHEQRNKGQRQMMTSDDYHGYSRDFKDYY
jgi:cytochrome c1